MARRAARRTIGARRCSTWSAPRWCVRVLPPSARTRVLTRHRQVQAGRKVTLLYAVEQDKLRFKCGVALVFQTCMMCL
jgi:hypothetical protein